jgi:hypothetical protein
MMKRARLFRKEDRPLWIVGATAFVVSALVNAPAALIASAATASSPLIRIGAAEGTIWRGELRGVVQNGVLLGDIAYRTAPLALLTGNAAADLESRDGALQGTARIALSPWRVRLRRVNARFNLGAIRQYTFFGARYEGGAVIKAKSLTLSRTGCKAEEAKLSTDALDTLAARWSGEALPLQGDISCEADRMRITLEGSGADGAVRVDLAIAPDLSYEAALTAEPARTEIGVALRAFGFEGPDDRLSWRAVGRLKGLTS